ncbi:hypothetical protein NW768_011223 [Fusarium equiseti]|uniref:Uncharacterized protein n=1 Tax=Fusarium equiseti TaxID=61235 RepID=A0ABQ8QYF6_FUSEQ|nr:hypothetical protein NW768_011223 [Fusarium equiseti]
MITQIPVQADSGDLEMKEADGDVYMTEASGELETTDATGDVRDANGRLGSTHILQTLKGGGDRSGNIEGSPYNNHITFFIKHPHEDIVLRISVKEDGFSSLDSLMRRIKQGRPEARDLLHEMANRPFRSDGLAIVPFSWSNAKYKVASTPTDLYGTYDCILHGIDSKDRQNSASVLIWLAFSERPLTLDEMAVATAESRRRKQSKPDVKAMEDLVRVWKPFLVVHEGKVFFVHEKAKEYMKERGLAAQWLVELSGRRAKRRRLEYGRS